MVNFHEKYAIFTGILDINVQAALRDMAENGRKGAIITGTFKDETIAEIAKEISETTNCTCLPYSIDISEPKEIESLFHYAQEQFSQIHILIHGARIFPTATLEELNATEWDRCMDINLRGAHLCAREALKIMMPQQYGKIVYISSMITTKVNSQTISASYIASEAGLMVTLKYYGKLYGMKNNININAVSPNLRTPEGGSSSRSESVSSTISFLASDLSKDIMGVTIDVSGRSCYCNRIL